MTTQDLFMQHLISFLNVPYKWGGSNPLEGLDCSGLAQLALGFLGLDPPGDQTADALWQRYKGSKVEIPWLGCLSFYGKNEATHVGIMLGSVYMIEAGGGGRLIAARAEAAAAGAYVKISRASRRSDLLGYCNPGLPWGP